VSGFSPQWLTLREQADARARAADLAAGLAAGLAGPAEPGLVVHDLGCGTGSMARWLAPRLPGPQRWVLHDRDPGLLALAARGLPAVAADGSPVTAETRAGDVAALTADDLAGAALVTASALLDLLTATEVERVAAVCSAVSCRALLTLTVVGQVDLSPADPLDAAVAAAFDAHQRRTASGRRLLGPDAVEVAARAFAALGADVDVRSSPWRLGAADAELARAWLNGWVAAAGEQRPDLPVEAYRARRREQIGSGQLAVTVHHADLLAGWPR
jgi:trans-aconitate methyltransferase